VPNPSNQIGRPALPWSYVTAGGANGWPTRYLSTCTGEFQSPIALNSAEVQPADTGNIQINGYGNSMKGKMKITAFTAKFEFDLPSPIDQINPLLPYIEGDRYGTSPNRYQFLQFHWHWGSVSSRGSEHTLNGREYPAELHIVHWNTKYGNVGDAVTRRDGLAVLGFFYEVSQVDNPNLTPLLQAISGLALGSSASVSSFKLSSLLPTSGIPETYYSYQGGLTTPGCDQAVQWTVFDTTLSISDSQLNILRSLTYDSSGTNWPEAPEPGIAIVRKKGGRQTTGTTLNIVDNFRPPQDRRGRSVYYRTATSTSCSSATTAVAKTSGVVIGSVMGSLLTAVFLGLFSTIGGKNEPTHDDYYQSADGRYYSHSVQPEPDLFSGKWFYKAFG